MMHNSSCGDKDFVLVSMDMRQTWSREGDEISIKTQSLPTHSLQMACLHIRGI